MHLFHHNFVYPPAIMKSSSITVLGLGAAIVSLLSNFAGACSTKSGVTITFYGFPDNDPPGAGTAYNCGGRNNIAGGSLHHCQLNP